MSELEPTSSSSDTSMEMPNNNGGGGGNNGKSDQFVEPEKKRMRFTFQMTETGKRKLEERLGGILCCVVCLDLPKAAVYQVSVPLIIDINKQLNF